MEAIIQNILDKVESNKNAGNLAGARAVLESAIVSSPDEYRLYEELCDVFLFFGENEKAKNALEYAQKLEPESST